MTPDKVSEAMEWASLFPTRGVVLVKEVERLRAENAKLRAALNAMQEFCDCMEAQRKDEPLPEGHDDPDMSCGDGVCYQVGEIIKRGVEIAHAPAPSDKKGGK